MRVDLHATFKGEAVAVDKQGLSRWYFFTERLDSVAMKTARHASAVLGVQLSEAYVFKSFRLPWLERLLGCRLHAERGFEGGQGELLNSLIANKLGVPSPLAHAAYFDAWRGRLVLVTERLVSCRTLHDCFQDAGCDRRVLLRGAFSLLLESLGRGLYHADPNASNIMLNDLGDNWFLIDFECCIPLACQESQALALQASSLWDWRVQPLVTREAYREWLMEFMLGRFSAQDVQRGMEWFDRYSLQRPDRQARKRRLQLVSGGCSDIRKTLVR